MTTATQCKIHTKYILKVLLFCFYLLHYGRFCWVEMKRISIKKKIRKDLQSSSTLFTKGFLSCYAQLEGGQPTFK